MKIALVTDAWMPQVNGVVTTLVELVRQLQQRGHEVLVIHPGLFRTRHAQATRELILPCDRSKIGNPIEEWRPDAIHLATEGPLGWAGRKSSAYATAFVHHGFSHPIPRNFARRFADSACLGLCVISTLSSPVCRGYGSPREVMSMLARRGFRHLRSWTHGVDTQLFPLSQPLRCLR